MKMPTADEMRAEFHRLNAELAKGLETVRPIQEAYENARAEIEALEAKQVTPLAERLVATREALGLHEIQRQLALLSRALGGETGAPPAAEKVAEPT